MLTIVLPKEHGAWAMLILPFMVSLAVHEQNVLQLPLFLGMFFLYLSLYPLMMILRNKQNAQEYSKWLVGYGTVAIVFLGIPLMYYPQLLYLGVLLIPLLTLNMYFTRLRRERELINNFSAVAGLGLGAVACGYLAAGQWTITSLWIWLLCVVFFMGSVFFVKSMLREKNNPVFQPISWGYHVGVLLIAFLFTNGWLLVLAYVPSLFRAVWGSGRALAPLQIGQLEIVNSLWFFIFVTAYFK